MITCKQRGIVEVQFSKEAAVILENHTLEITVVYFPHRYYWALKSIAVQTSVKQLPLYYTAFAFRILLNGRG